MISQTRPASGVDAVGGERSFSGGEFLIVKAEEARLSREVLAKSARQADWPRHGESYIPRALIGSGPQVGGCWEGSRSPRGKGRGLGSLPGLGQLQSRWLLPQETLA